MIQCITYRINRLTTVTVPMHKAIISHISSYIILFNLFQFYLNGIKTAIITIAFLINSDKLRKESFV